MLNLSLLIEFITDLERDSWRYADTLVKIKIMKNIKNMAEVDVNPHKANQERKKTMRELDQRINRLAKMEKALKMLETAVEEREEENKPEVTNGKLAKKYNFVQLRKK